MTDTRPLCSKSGVAVMVVLMCGIAGCAGTPGDGETDAAAPNSKPASTVSKDGVHKVGIDVKAGVYTTDEAIDGGCFAFTSSVADYDLADDDADPDAFIAGATRNGSGQRLVLNVGEYFNTSDCKGWKLEDGTRPKSDDPASLEGACNILIGEGGAVEDALEYPKHKESAHEDQKRSEVQDRLFAIVSANNEGLSDPAGQLVDFLDDPNAYVENGRVSSLITDSVSTIKKRCAGA